MGATLVANKMQKKGGGRNSEQNKMHKNGRGIANPNKIKSFRTSMGVFKLEGVCVWGGAYQ